MFRSGHLRLGNRDKYLCGHFKSSPEFVHRSEHGTDATPERVALLGHRVDGHLPHLRVATLRPRAPGRPSGQRVRTLFVEPVADLTLHVRLDDALGQRPRLAALAAADETQLPAHHDRLKIISTRRAANTWHLDY